MTWRTARIPEYVWSCRIRRRQSVVCIHGNHVAELFDTVSKHQVKKGRRGLYLQVTSTHSYMS